MPQRPEDYMSTKNVGGNRTGGTDARTNDPFAYLKTKPEHAYLGHFKSRRFLEQGHNERARVPARRPQPMRAPGPLPSGEAFGLRSARQMLRSPVATQAIKSQIAAERPVLAAKVATRAAGITGAARRQAIRTARQSPESARSERRAARGSRRLGRVARALERY